jgi:hypothetical protein
MSYFEVGNKQMQDLERMVDATSLSVVLAVLGCIAEHKALKLDSQDLNSNHWRVAARVCERTSIEVNALQSR